MREARESERRERDDSKLRGIEPVSLSTSSFPFLFRMPPAKSPFPRESATRFQRRVRGITAVSTAAVGAGLLLFADWGGGEKENDKRKNVFSGVRPAAKRLLGRLFPAEDDDIGGDGDDSSGD